MAASTSQRRRSNLQSLLGIARRVQQQSLAGDDIQVTASELAVAEREAKELRETLRARSWVLGDDMKLLWREPGQDTAAFLALFGLAIRRSNPFATGDSPATSYTSIRRNLFQQFDIFLKDPNAWQKVCCEVLGPALLRADTLQCYSRLLAEAAEQLKPAARVVQLPNHSRNSDMQRAGAEQAAPATSAKPRQQQPQGPRAQDARRCQLEMLLQEPLYLVKVLSLGLSHLSGTGNELNNAGTSSSSSSGATFLQLPSHPVRHLRDQVHSSWLLEHWAHVLLLGTAPALAGGDENLHRWALTMHSSLLLELHTACQKLDLDWVDVVRRPCGGALALTHMAHLCAALDGGDVFGRPRPAVIVLPRREQAFPTQHAAAGEYDRAAVQRGQALLLQPSGSTFYAWMDLLREAHKEAPRCLVGEVQQQAAATAAVAGNDVRSGVEEEGEAGGRGAGRAGGQVRGSAGDGPQAGVSATAAAGAEGPGHAAGLATPDSLPPLNRSATIDLCLRLARGVLARWGGPLPGVQLHDDAGGWGSTSPLLPKVNGSALLYRALACSRMALLPDVWGRQRVRGRTRAQLRAWWEAYVAAAQHSEALLVAEAEEIEYPAWMKDELGVTAEPSADAVAAVAAGLLPCVTRQVTRMGAVSDGGPVWFHPSTFAGTMSCWKQVLLHGPLGQVEELVSAMGRRLRLAAEELRAAAVAAAEGRRGRRPAGRSATWLAVVTFDALHWARSTVTILCLQQAAGQYPGAVGLTQCWRGGHELGGREPAAEGGGPGAAAGAARAEAAGPPGQPGLYAVRSSIAAAELLPALSRGVQVCAELVGRGEGGQRGGREGLGAGPGDGVSADVLVQVLDGAGACTVSTLLCASLVLAKHAEAVVGAAQQRQQQDTGAGGAASGRGCDGNGGNQDDRGHGDSGGVSGDGGGDSRDGAQGHGGAVGGSGGGGDTPWRQLLLRDVRLMELLVAALELHAWGAAAAAAGRWAAGEAQAKLGPLSLLLVRVLCQAACVFPAEFRAAVDREGGCAAQSDPQTAAAAAGRGIGGHADGHRPRMTLAAIAAVLAAGDHQDARRLLGHVLAGGAAPASMAMVWGVPDAYLGCVISKERAQDALRTLLLPAEARAAVAAAQGAAAPAAGP